jgi:hypothetical protein
MKKLKTSYPKNIEQMHRDTVMNIFVAALLYI